MPIALFTHYDCLKHEMGDLHPEEPGRLNSINDRLVSSGLDFVIHQHDAPMATREHLVAVHDDDYVDNIFENAPSEGYLQLDGDTMMNKDSLSAALWAAGAAVGAVDTVMTTKVRKAFCSIRPPGHHAEKHRSMGFCIFNNVAVGAAHAMQEFGLERIAICDFDVHHGNGTEDIFLDDPRVMFCSSFQHPFYPFTNIGDEPDHIIKTPLEAGIGGTEFREKIAEQWLPALDAFKPQLMMMSAGFDAHVEDDMGQLKLREPDYQWVTAELCKIADRHAEGRVVSVLEGGYNLSALGRSVSVHLDALLHHA